MLDGVQEAMVFTQLDLHRTYNLTWIKEADEYKTAFERRCGQFQLQVLPFGLTTTLAIFQLYIHDCLLQYIDDFAVCYHDDILISMANDKEHEAQVHQVLQQLKEFGLQCKAMKCHFGILEVSIVGFAFTQGQVGMEWDWIATIEYWLTPKSV